MKWFIPKHLGDSSNLRDKCTHLAAVLQEVNRKSPNSFLESPKCFGIKCVKTLKWTPKIREATEKFKKPVEVPFNIQSYPYRYIIGFYKVSALKNWTFNLSFKMKYKYILNCSIKFIFTQWQTNKLKYVYRLIFLTCLTSPVLKYHEIAASNIEYSSK